MGDRGLVEALGRFAAFPRGREEHAPQVETQGSPKLIAALVGVLAEDSFLFVQPARHIPVLRTLAREHEDHGALGRFRVRAQNPLRVQALQGIRGLGRALGYHHPSMGEPPPPTQKRVGRVPQALLRTLPEVLSKALRRNLQGRLGLGGQHEHLDGARRPRPLPGRGLLENHVGVRSSHAERADPGSSGPAGLLPLRQLRIRIKGAVPEVDLWVRSLKMEQGRDLVVLHHEGRLDEGGDSGRPIQMPKVCLDRTDRTVAPPLCPRLEGPCERLDLNRVPQRSARAVGLHIADRVRADLGYGEGLGDGLGLPPHAGSGVARLLGPVVVYGAAPDDGVDVVAIAEGVGEALQNYHAHPASEDGAGGPFVERPAVPVRGKDPALLVEVAAPEADVDRGGPRKGHVALPVQQALAGEVDRDQGRGAERLHRDGRTGQVTLVGDDRGQGIAVVEHSQGRNPRARAPHDLGVLEEIHRVVRARGRTREDANPPGVLRHVVAGGFKGCPGRLQEKADLGVHDLRLPGIEAEEAGVKEFNVLEKGRGLHVRDAIAHHWGLRREEADGLYAVPEVLPEAGEGGRPWYPYLHSHYGDVVDVRACFYTHRLTSKARD